MIGHALYVSLLFFYYFFGWDDMPEPSVTEGDLKSLRSSLEYRSVSGGEVKSLMNILDKFRKASEDGDKNKVVPNEVVTHLETMSGKAQADAIATAVRKYYGVA